MAPERSGAPADIPACAAELLSCDEIAVVDVHSGRIS